MYNTNYQHLADEFQLLRGQSMNETYTAPYGFRLQPSYRLQLDIPKELVKQARLRAIKEDVSLTRLIKAWLEDYAAGVLSLPSR
jgi:hypothetical protein